MKSLIKVISILAISIFFVACNASNNESDNDNTSKKQTYLIEYYKKADFTYFIGQQSGRSYQYIASIDGENTHIDAIDNLEYNYGYRYKIEAKYLNYVDVTIISMVRLIEKTFTPMPFNTLHHLKHFKAENTKDNEYKILNTLNVKILDRNTQTKFDDIIARSGETDFQSDNNETFKLYFEFDYNEENETINFIKLINIKSM